MTRALLRDLKTAKRNGSERGVNYQRFRVPLLVRIRNSLLVAVPNTLYHQKV